MLVCCIDSHLNCFYFLQVSEMAVSELPGNPNAVWTVKTNIAGYLDMS